MDQSIFISLAVPFSYPLNALPNHPIQRFYFNGPQMDLCNFRLQQCYYQGGFQLQQKRLQDLLLSKISKQDNFNNSYTYYPQEGQYEEQKAKTEEIIYKTEGLPLDGSPVSSHSQLKNTSDSYNYAILHILDYLLTHFGKVSKDQIEKLKEMYAHNLMLTQLLNVLICRYKAASKSREDMVRFVIRKSITWLRDQTRDKSQMSAKVASITLCHRYFVNNATEFQNNEKILGQSDDELLSLLLPYKKNSRHPVVNSQFIKEIFSSKEFCQDYLEYLAHYSETMEQENEKKIKQFVDFLMLCIQENSLHKVLNYKRLPWLDLWIETSQGIGYEIYDLNVGQVSMKREKKIKTT